MPDRTPKMPEHVAAIAASGFATWASDDVDPQFRERFDADRIPVAGIRNVRVWGLQVDDERELPGHERTQIPDEELDRLDTHLAEVADVLKRKEPVGRRLDFLMQEFNREANTLGSKANDVETTQAAVDLKVLIEQMREQVQNVE